MYLLPDVEKAGEAGALDLLPAVSNSLTKQLTIAVASKKGGVGKSNLSIQLATTFAKACPDKQIMLVDSDPEESRTVSVWQRRRLSDQDKNSESNLTITEKTGVMTQWLNMQKKVYDVIILDLPGFSEGAAFVTALKSADIAILPFRPEEPDLATLPYMLTSLAQICTANPRLSVMTVVNIASPQSYHRQSLIETKDQLSNPPPTVLRKVPGYRHAETVVFQRKAYTDAFLDGRGVIEQPVKETVKKAQQEIVSLALEVISNG